MSENMIDKLSDHEGFVDDVEGESHDNVEMLINQKIDMYNQNKDRNVQALENPNQHGIKSSNRLVSANPSKHSKAKELNSHPLESVDQEEEEEHHDIGTNKETFYKRFNLYVKQNHMLPKDFYHMGNDKLSSDEFKDRLEVAGFNFGKEEFEDVMFDVTDANFNVVFQTFCSKISAWEKNNTERTLEILKDKTLKLAQESRKKLNKAETSQKNFLIRPQSGLLYSSNGGLSSDRRPFSGISGISTKSKQTFGTTQNDFKLNSTSSDNFRKTNLENRSSYYLQENKKREAKQDQLILMTLDKARNEFELDCLEKMNEANEITQSLGEPITFRAYNGMDGHVRCHIYEYDQLKAELTMKEFVREYKILKQRCAQIKGLPIWETLTKQKSSAANFYFSSAKTLAAESSEVLEPIDTRKGVKKDRQKELKAVLYETMKLSASLKIQLGKLKKAGLAPENQILKS